MIHKSCFDLDSNIHGSCCNGCINDEADFSEGIGNGALLEKTGGNLTVSFCCKHAEWATREIEASNEANYDAEFYS
jgi:hypothetical protein